MMLAPGGAGSSNASLGILNLEKSSDAASGVGVQVLYNNAPAALNTRILTSITATSGDYNIPLKARYYQNQTSVTPGRADATATFTMTYQ